MCHTAEEDYLKFSYTSLYKIKVTTQLGTMNNLIGGSLEDNKFWQEDFLKFSYIIYTR